MRAFALIAVLSGCGSSSLVTATNDYAALSRVSTRNLSRTPDVVTSICHERAELEYVTATLANPNRDTTFDSFYAHEEHILPGLPIAMKATWQQQCDAYRTADRIFSDYVAVLGDYANALAMFSADRSDPGSDFGDTVSQIGTRVATLVPAAGAYKTALAGIGAPFGTLASVVEGRWKSKEIGSLVQKVDPTLHLVLDRFGDYVKAVRTELDEARRALGDVSASLHADANATNATTVTIELHPLVAATAIQQQFMAATVEVDFGARLAESERRLDALDEVITQLRLAHGKLADGWKRGEDSGAETIKALALLAKDIDRAVDSFVNPVRGAGK